jgi:hypothetical protein
MMILSLYGGLGTKILTLVGVYLPLEYVSSMLHDG